MILRNIRIDIMKKLKNSYDLYIVNHIFINSFSIFSLFLKGWCSTQTCSPPNSNRIYKALPTVWDRIPHGISCITSTDALSLLYINGFQSNSSS